MAETKTTKTLLTVKEFLNSPVNNFTDREKFSYELSLKNEEPKSFEDWKTKISNVN